MKYHGLKHHTQREEMVTMPVMHCLSLVAEIDVHNTTYQTTGHMRLRIGGIVS